MARVEEGIAAGGVRGEAGAGDLLLKLKEDHHALLASLERMEQSRREERDLRLKLFSSVAQELQMHLEGEDRFFYTALERHEEARGVVLESFEEHYLARQLVSALQTLALDDERWCPRLRVLRRVFEFHIQREERELFTLAEKLLSKEQMQGILRQLLQLKKEKTTC